MLVSTQVAAALAALPGAAATRVGGFFDADDRKRRRDATEDNGAAPYKKRAPAAARRALQLASYLARPLAGCGGAQCPRNPGVFRFFSTLEARISVNLGPIRLLLGPLIISARVLEI